nr:hypothetical protein [Tanacetum cinerariifolium]
MLDDSENEADVDEVRRAQNEEGGVRRHPNMSFTNMLRAMDDRLGDMDTNIFKLSDEFENLTAVMSEMFEQYDQFYREIDAMSQQYFSTAPTAYTDLFGLFGTLDAGPSTSHHPENDMDEESFLMCF